MLEEKFDHILVLGFGGPEKESEILPFLRRTVRGKGIPDNRLKEVEEHYIQVGGRSPYNDHAREFVQALSDKLSEEGVDLPIYLGMRNWRPELKLALREIKKEGYQKGILIILSPFRSPVSFENYLAVLNDVKKEEEAEHIYYESVPSWCDDSLFIQAHIEQIQGTLKQYSLDEEKETTELVFTAHSIPEKVAKESSYAREFRTTAADIANGLGWQNWNIAYQSRSGNPKEPWLGPDVLEWINYLKNMGAESILCVPIGFLLDNVEILFDLDTEVKDQSQKLGLNYYRSRSVALNSSFIDCMYSQIHKLLNPIAV